MKMEQQLENTSALDGHDLTTYKFSELLDGYLAHMVRGPEETDWGADAPGRCMPSACATKWTNESKE